MNETSTFTYLNTSGKIKSNNNKRNSLPILNPDEIVINTILNYSKSLKVLKSNNCIFSFNQN